MLDFYLLFSTHFGKSSLLQKNDGDYLHIAFMVYNLTVITSKRISMRPSIRMVVCYEERRLGVMNKDVAKPHLSSSILLVYYFKLGLVHLLVNASSKHSRVFQALL